MLNIAPSVPSLIKYMGSKTEIIQEVISALNDIHQNDQPVCDLFSGSCTLAGYLRENNIDFYSNDIQVYSRILANTYCGDYRWEDYPDVTHWINLITQCVDMWSQEFNDLITAFNYTHEFELDSFNEIENMQRDLMQDEGFYARINNSSMEFIRTHHLFTKYYSGTYWNFNQCIWIDCCKYIIDEHCHDNNLKNILLSCLMFAMAYNSQSTGHYAQFRKAETESSMNDILIYRRKEMSSFFIRKYAELRETLININAHCLPTSLDYKNCIDTIPNHTLVYADPPYCFVHYSRFYHILETLVRYDYPEVQHGGRYRDDRHQSPFCITSQVGNAFFEMFQKLRDKECNLVLSYSKSKTTMIPLDKLIIKAFSIFNMMEENIVADQLQGLQEAIDQMLLDQINNNGLQELHISDIIQLEQFDFDITIRLLPYEHSTMGRASIKNISVYEALIIISNIL